MSHFIKLLSVFIRIGALNEMAYRANFWIQLFESALSFATALGTVFVVFAQTDDLGGWQRADLICLLGIYFMILGSINVVVAPSISRFMEDIVSGNLDFTLTKPADAQMLVSISEFRLWKLIDVFMGTIVLAWGLSEKSGAIGWLPSLQFGFSLLAAGVIVYSFWMILATLAFWFIRIENITMIFWSMYTAGRWPVGIYPGWMKWMLTILVPITFAVTIPAEAITGRLETNSLIGALAFALILALISRRFWLFGLRHYSGASA